METIEFTDRYKATGTPYPDPETMCEGQCEGMGVVPVYYGKGAVLGMKAEVRPADAVNDEEGPWLDLWNAAEAKEPSKDGWHFVVCPACNGTRKRPV